ncbi:uncharacterized protein EI90DRAFT_3279490 [Cantharellus anzutake]|uniref:uncharacterized protein n=1 Tax=Cantharellus anzutake TaxID=1750568 RepID=UPI0019053289|nr:uncharacterized protein EI90DRAFT_3279490 [Cantharellus anzutake]KAF8339079.1 hypothetical protein EI90DRAFT_3279490 [Cantharellus anzutake]
MASASDVRAILQLPPTFAGPSQLKKPSAPGPRKPEGISRELYSLIGDSAPTLVAQYSRPKFKPKLDLGARNRTSDSLELFHWAKVGIEEKESKFSKYNVPSQVYSYTQEEYDKHLQDEAWSKEETDYLFSLAKEYDLRFLVMADRYQFPGGKSRQIEDLKSRYYGVCRRLIRNRPWMGDEASKNQLLASYNFDPEQERNRKAYLNGLFDRTPEQIAEEEQLYVEIKRLELNERRYSKEREELLRTFAGVESGLPNLPANWDIAASVAMDKKRKKRLEGEISLDSPVGPGSGMSLFSQKRRDTGKSSATDMLHCIVRYDPPSILSSTKSSAPVHLRSSRIPVPKSSHHSKVTTILAELGISTSRLVMPTATNIARLETLQAAAVNVMEMKKSLDRVEQDIRIMEAQLNVRDSEAPAEEDGRQQSLEAGASTLAQKFVDKQAHQRKRSVSTSSAGTSVARGATKRVKRE